MGKLIKIFFWGSLVLCVSVVAMVIAFSPAKKPHPALSAKDWADHREKMVTFSKAPFIHNSAQGMYDDATELLRLAYVHDCADPGCAELRYFLKAVQKQTGDGRLTPAGLEDLRQDAFLVAEAVRAEDVRRAPARQK